jgi:hypothetical protein
MPSDLEKVSILVLSMKYVIAYIIGFLFSQSLLAQVNIHKVWIGEHHEYLDLRNGDTIIFASPGQVTKAIYHYDKEILSIPKSYTTTGATIAHMDDNAYRVINITNNLLELQAIDNAGQENSTLFRGQKQMVFTESTTVFNNSNKPFHFQKLYYEYHEWYTRLVTKILIDSIGIVYYTYGNHAQDDTSNKEYPKKGQLTKGQLNALITILKTSDINNFPSGYGNSGNANSILLGFYFNGMKVMSRGNVHLFPYLHRNLLEYLQGIPNTIILTQQYNPVIMGF